jgi:hypothetical protein
MLFASPAFHQFVVKAQVQSTYNFTLMKPLLASAAKPGDLCLNFWGHASNLFPDANERWPVRRVMKKVTVNMG